MSTERADQTSSLNEIAKRVHVKKTKAVLRCCKIKRLRRPWKTNKGDVHRGKEEEHNYFLHCQNWLMLVSLKQYLFYLVKAISSSIGGNRNYEMPAKKEKKNLALKKCSKEKACFKHTYKFFKSFQIIILRMLLSEIFI